MKINADSLAFISNAAPARILAATVDHFETLSRNGKMKVVVASVGVVPSLFSVSVVDCSPNILPVFAQAVTLLAAESKQLTFDLISTVELGSVDNVCFVELKNVEATLLDRVRVDFNTSDVIKSSGAQSGNPPNSSVSGSPPPSIDLVCGQCSFFDVSCNIANSCTVNLIKSVSSVILPAAGLLLMLKVSFLLSCPPLKHKIPQLLSTPSVQASLARAICCRRNQVVLLENQQPKYVLSSKKQRPGMLGLVQ